MAWSPGEYGTATSISIFSKYFLLLLKRRPPRDMSSQATTSSAMPGRRTQALKLTRVRACLRRLSRSLVATLVAVFVAGPAAVSLAGIDAAGVFVSATSAEPRSIVDSNIAGSAGAEDEVWDGVHAVSESPHVCSGVPLALPGQSDKSGGRQAFDGVDKPVLGDGPGDAGGSFSSLG